MCACVHGHDMHTLYAEPSPTERRVYHNIDWYNGASISTEYGMTM